MVDHNHRVIVAVGLSNQPPDAEHLEPMLERIVASAGALPDVMTMDAGSWSEDNAKACSDQGIDAYIATGRLPHGQPPPPLRGPVPRGADHIAAAQQEKHRYCRTEAMLCFQCCWSLRTTNSW